MSAKSNATEYLPLSPIVRPTVIGVNLECGQCWYVLYVANDRLSTPRIVCPFCQTVLKS